MFLFIILYSKLKGSAPAFWNAAIFLSSSFWKARCALIGQLSSVLWLAEYPGIYSLAIGRAGDCLGPRALRRGLHNRSIPYTPVHQSSRAEIASLFIGYSWIVTHLQLIQLMLQFQSGSRLLDICVTKVLRTMRCKRLNRHAKKYSS